MSCRTCELKVNELQGESQKQPYLIPNNQHLRFRTQLDPAKVCQFSRNSVLAYDTQNDVLRANRRSSVSSPRTNSRSFEDLPSLPNPFNVLLTLEDLHILDWVLKKADEICLISHLQLTSLRNLALDSQDTIRR